MFSKLLTFLTDTAEILIEAAEKVGQIIYLCILFSLLFIYGLYIKLALNIIMPVTGKSFI
jgi:hypothetical protein